MTALDLRAVVGCHVLLQVVKGIALAVGQASVVALVGANGAGKSTLLRMIAGLHPTEPGGLLLFGAEVTQMAAHERVRAGIALSSEGRRMFGDLIVRENLVIAAENGRRGDWTLATVCDAFAQITPLSDRAAEGLLGGQRQAVAIARALITNPKVLRLNEVSLGLSPAAVGRGYQSFAG